MTNKKPPNILVIIRPIAIIMVTITTPSIKTTIFGVNTYMGVSLIMRTQGAVANN